MQNLIKVIIGVVMFSFAGLFNLGAAVIDGAVNCVACNQNMCMYHVQKQKSFKYYVQANRPDKVQEDAKDKLDKAKNRERDRKPEQVPPDVLKQFDVDKDGKLDKKEQFALFKDRLEKNERLKKRVLEKFDADKDGKLSEKELEEAFKQLEHLPVPPGPPKRHDPSQVAPVSPSEPSPKKE